MNITTGTGRQSWRPKQLSLHAFDRLPLGAPNEALPAPGINVLTAKLNYGPLGVCRGGTLTLPAMPAAWGVAAYSRLVRLRLTSELDGGAPGSVFTGVVQQARLEAQGGVTVELIGVHDVYADATLTVGSALSWPNLTGDLRQFGVSGPTDPAHTVRSEAWNRVLEPYPNSEWGVGPDMAAVAGRPESATPAQYARDSRALDFRSLGFSIPDYATEWTFDPGDGWRKYSARREGVPAFVPRRAAAATANPSTITATRSPPLVFNRSFEFFGTYPAPQFDGQPHSVTYVGAIYRVVIPPSDQESHNSRFILTFPYRLDMLPQNHTGELGVQIAEVGATGYSETKILLSASDVALEKGVTLDLPPELVSRGATLDVLFVAGFAPPAGQTQQPGTLVLHPVKSNLEYETPNMAGLVLPPGWTAPYWTGPTFEFRLPGWHVPPLRVSSLPGGLAQHVAGAEVTWAAGEASTRLLTAALPYPGQRRRA